ncbi:MAG: MBL fold metallo-hydrolase [Thermoleophilia bacterium]
MERVGAWRLEDSGGWQPWLLRLGVLEFEPGIFHPAERVAICVNALLLRGHGQTLLVDAGSGPADVLYPGAAALDEALALAGASRADVDAVVLTHLDFDHAGGVLDGEWGGALTAAFPRVVLSEVEIDFWRAHPGGGTDVSQPILAAYETRLELAPDGAEFLPGLRLVSAPGHRAGHCVLPIGDGLVHAADVMHCESHLEHPEWDSYFDADPEQGIATRLAWPERLAEQGVQVVFSHFPTAGRIGPGRTWIPAW